MTGVIGGTGADATQVHNNLAYRMVEKHAAAKDEEKLEEQKRHVLRVVCFSVTFGYSCGALFGGTLYQYGGFTACARMHLAICSLQAILSYTLPVVHDSLRLSRTSAAQPPSNQPEAIDPQCVEANPELAATSEEEESGNNLALAELSISPPTAAEPPALTIRTAGIVIPLALGRPSYMRSCLHLCAFT